jgi:hypothetical protein
VMGSEAKTPRRYGCDRMLLRNCASLPETMLPTR